MPDHSNNSKVSKWAKSIHVPRISALRPEGESEKWFMDLEEGMSRIGVEGMFKFQVARRFMTAEPLKMWLKAGSGDGYDNCVDNYMRRIARVSTEYEYLVGQARTISKAAVDIEEAVERVGHLKERLDRLVGRYEDRAGLQTHEYKAQRLQELVLRERYDTKISYDEYRDVAIDMSARLGRQHEERLNSTMTQTQANHPWRLNVNRMEDPQRLPGTIPVLVGNAKTYAIVDSGADVCVMGKRGYERLRQDDSPWEWRNTEQGITSPWGPCDTAEDHGRRPCGYGRLNKLTTPRIGASIEDVRDSNWFCSVDLRSSYWQVPMKEASRENEVSCDVKIWGTDDKEDVKSAIKRSRKK
eukprot:GHVO01053405.1.p1 GENE.GHVO01053405.1~~GHVO01053405.1.p1  ORF type:complete len:392 (+),score=20.43 GHVO01053405.1:114-1178(+)